MTRKQIDLHPDAIAPVVRGLWHAAAEKLDEAQAGTKQMETARDRIAYENGWVRFVESLEEFWVRFFDEGKSNFGPFQPWAGTIDAQRKADELLNYLVQSRHQTQHGRISLKWTEPKLHIAPGFNGHIQNLRIFPDGTFEIGATPTPGSSVEAAVTYNPGDAELPEIYNAKWKQVFAPPKSHAGQPIADSTPLTAARLALAHYTAVLEQAFAKFGKAG